MPLNGDDNNAHTLEVATAIYNQVRSEMLKRGEQRTQFEWIALLVTGPTLLSREWLLVLLTPFALMFIGTKWVQHDKRIGEGARFLYTYIEPLMKQLSGGHVMGWDEYLNTLEDRAFKRLHFSAVQARLFIPALQLGSVVYGLYLFHGSGSQAPFAWVMTLVLVDLVLIIITFTKVKHVRIPPPGYQAR